MTQRDESGAQGIGALPVAPRREVLLPDPLQAALQLVRECRFDLARLRLMLEAADR
jgi:hypothetical protein